MVHLADYYQNNYHNYIENYYKNSISFFLPIINLFNNLHPYDIIYKHV